MQRIAFSILIVLQIIVIGALVFMFEQIDTTGKEIIVVSEDLDEDFYYDGVNREVQHIYKRFNISYVPDDEWAITEELTYQDIVYVTLTKNAQNIHEVKNVSLKKPKTVEGDDVVIKARYDYHSEEGNHQLMYGFEWIENVDQYGSFRELDQVKVTVLFGKFGQQKIKNVEKVETE